MPFDDSRFRALAAARRRVALGLTGAVMLVYFGFISLIAWNKPLLGTELLPGLSLGILLGALVILTCWLLTYVYLRWANRKYDPELEALRLGGPGNPASASRSEGTT
ncbi:MAG TPA: DUF485 domain-containing protein [Gemmatimonadales bacterium]|nr:DUF485 domain-containing protein [Gemmatimonadales bacterium]